MTLQTSTISVDYGRDGFVFPFDIVSEAEAKELRADLESAETEFADHSEKLSIVRSYPARLLPSFDKLIRHPNLIDAVSRILGPDMLVWGSGLFIKEANTPHYVSWHQDLNYWGLDDIDTAFLMWIRSPTTTCCHAAKNLPLRSMNRKQSILCCNPARPRCITDISFTPLDQTPQTTGASVFQFATSSRR